MTIGIEMFITTFTLSYPRKKNVLAAINEPIKMSVMQPRLSCTKELYFQEDEWWYSSSPPLGNIYAGQACCSYYRQVLSKAEENNFGGFNHYMIMRRRTEGLWVFRLPGVP